VLLLTELFSLAERTVPRAGEVLAGGCSRLRCRLTDSTPLADVPARRRAKLLPYLLIIESDSFN
jgi:hypothetical protein